MTPARQNTGHWGQSPALLKNQEKPHGALSHPGRQGPSQREADGSRHCGSLPTSPRHVWDFFRRNPPTEAWVSPSLRRKHRHHLGSWGGGCDGNSHPGGHQSKCCDFTYTRCLWGPQGIAMPLSCHRWKLSALNTKKLSVWNGLTAGPDIHRFSIGIFPQDLRGQVTWGASKTCSGRESGGTLNPLSLSLNPHQQFSPSPFLLLLIWLHKLSALGQQETMGWASCSARSLNQRANTCALKERPLSPEAARMQC